MRRHGVFALSLLLAGLVWALLHFAAGALLTQLEERAGDLVWRLGAERKDERRLIVVDVDERSLREVGPWPWPRWSGRCCTLPPAERWRAWRSAPATWSGAWQPTTATSAG